MEGEVLLASSPEEALALKDPDSIFFAGGSGIGYKDSGIRAKKLIVIRGIPGIRDIAEQEDGFIRIGALVTFTQALEDPSVPGYLKEALRFCGSLQKRNMATIGGNVASWRDDSYLIPTLLASGAMLCVEGKEGSAVIGMDAYADERERYRDALITALLVRPETMMPDTGKPENFKPEIGKPGSVRVFTKRFSNTVESHAYLTISAGREGDRIRTCLAVRGRGIFHADGTDWEVLWKKAGVQDDWLGSEEYKRYLTRVTLESMYEELGGEGGGAS